MGANGVQVFAGFRGLCLFGVHPARNQGWPARGAAQREVACVGGVKDKADEGKCGKTQGSINGKSYSLFCYRFKMILRQSSDSLANVKHPQVLMRVVFAPHGLRPQHRAIRYRHDTGYFLSVKQLLPAAFPVRWKR